MAAADTIAASHIEFLEHAHQVAALFRRARGLKDRSYWAGVLRHAAAELDRGTLGERCRVGKLRLRGAAEEEELRICRAHVAEE